ncbi:MAG: peptidoglycan DD-metalloendopeptidase family protein [Balneolaceae bacterium]|nr:peptidoglycan DD-metalloendopeptidase family protein [Balneolaceae bacterium]
MRIFATLLLILLGLAPIASAQTYEEKRKEILTRQTNTRAEINVLDARIRTYQQRIQDTENRYEELYKQYQNVNRLISLQDDKISTLELEQRQIQEEIELTESEISLREKDLEQLKQNLREILLYTYKNGRASNLELIVTAGSINQMVIRSYYLQKLEEQKEKQAEQIRVRQRDLEGVKEDLQESLVKNELVLDEIRDEKVKLSSQQSVQRNNVEKIKAESTDLLSELRKIRQQRENLESSFSALISMEDELRKAENERLERLAAARNIADAARRAEEIAKYSTPTRASFVSDETLAAYERTFAASKGSLQWPVDSKTVSKKFGITRNPLYGTRTEHPGINIVTDPRSEVRVVADGYVFAIQPTPGFGNTVFVKHGSYYTIYGNLSQITVQNSSILKAGQVVGLSGTESSELGETVFFVVRKNKTYLNPEDWLER